MADWLLAEEMPFGSSLFVGAPGRGAAEAKAPVRVITLRNVTVLDNKRLFGKTDVVLTTIVLDGCADMKSRRPFWMQEFSFPGVADGAALAIDPDLGVQIYRGTPEDFLNLYVLVMRNTEATRHLAQVLQDNLVAEGIGTVVQMGVSIFATLPAALTGAAVRDLVTKAVKTTLDYFAKQQNLAIGVYYGSLLKERDYGVGPHPASYPPDRLSCGGAMEIAYEVMAWP